jgi:hypothetical protein
MLTPIKISESLLTKYLEAVGDLMCGPSAEFVEELAKAEKYFKAPAANKGEGNKLRVSAAYRWLCACSEWQAFCNKLMSLLIATTMVVAVRYECCVQAR